MNIQPPPRPIGVLATALSTIHSVQYSIKPKITIPAKYVHEYIQMHSLSWMYSIKKLRLKKFAKMQCRKKLRSFISFHFN